MTRILQHLIYFKKYLQVIQVSIIFTLFAVLIYINMNKGYKLVVKYDQVCTILFNDSYNNFL